METKQQEINVFHVEHKLPERNAPLSLLPDGETEFIAPRMTGIAALLTGLVCLIIATVRSTITK